MDSLSSQQSATNHKSSSGYIEQKLSSLLLQAPAAIAVLEAPHFKYTFANPLYLKLFGQTAEELLGKTISDTFSRGEGQGVYALFNKVFTTGEPFVAAEYKITAPDNGEEKIAYYNFAIQPAKDNDGRVTDLIVHAYEVTQQ